MIYQADDQELARRRLLAQSIAEEPLPSRYHHDYDKEVEDLIDLEVKGSVIGPVPPKPVSIAHSEVSGAALDNQGSERTVSPSRFQPEEDSASTVADEVYDTICK